MQVARRRCLHAALALAGTATGIDRASLAAVPQRVDAVLGDGRGGVYAETPRGVFFSRTGAAPWTRIVGGGMPWQLVWLPDGRAVAASAEGLQVTRDGVRWTSLQPKLDQAAGAPPPAAPVRSVVCDRAGRLFALMAARGIWTSADGGASWQPLASEASLPLDTGGQRLHRSADRLYLGLVALVAHQSQAGPQPEPVRNVPFDAFTGQLDDGDGGLIFSMRGADSDGDARAAADLLGSAGHGCWRYSPGADGGWRWWRSPRAFTLRLRRGQTVYATTSDGAPGAACVGAWHLPTGRWTLAAPLVRAASHLAVEPRFWLARVPGAGPVRDAEAALFRSVDQGRHWERLPLPGLEGSLS